MERSPDVEDLLSHLETRIAHQFVRPESHRLAVDYLRGLLSNVRRKSGRRLAEYAERTSPDGVQRLLNGSTWDADRLRDKVRDYVVEQMGRPEGVFVIGDVGFTKRGDKSAGVAVQFNATKREIENCQTAVFLMYASSIGRALLDRELYLPLSWIEDRPRRRTAGVPDQVGYSSRAALAYAMVERSHRAGVPFAWVASSIELGRHAALRDFCTEHDIGYVLRIPADEIVAVSQGAPLSARHLHALMPAHASELRSRGRTGYATQWAAVRLPERDGAFSQALLVGGGSGCGNDLVFYRCRLPAASTLTELVGVAESPSMLDDCVAEAIQWVGLQDYEVRKYGAWYRHVTLSMLAGAGLNGIRATIPAMPMLFDAFVR